MPVTRARAAAFEVLLRVERQNSYASELLHGSRLAELSPADHGLLTELVMGVLRWRSVLDGIVAGQSSQPMAKLDLEVLTALRVGVYQLVFLDRIPAHAAINESVELVKVARKRSAAGLVNAVLRKIHKGAPRPGDLDPCDAHPLWLVERWEKHYGANEARRICAYDQTPPTPAVRITDAALVHDLESGSIRLTPGKLVANAFSVAGDLTRTKAFRERRLVLQDEASQLVALLVGQGNTVLDCCAAPGGKTRIIAERNPDAQILAMELRPHRADLLRKLIRESNVKVIAADARSVPLVNKFDRVLVDAPCSGTGTLARNPEIKWRLKEEDLLRLQKYQLEILAAAVERLAPRGRVVYSTCSLEPEENEHVIEKLVTKHPSVKIVDCAIELKKLEASGELSWGEIDSLLSGPFVRTIPGVHPCDGFFAALLERL
jgi:16S rRNA (cytosine967-C5)-methyltransferase